MTEPKNGFSAQQFVALLRRRFANSPGGPHEALLIMGICFHDLANVVHLLRLAEGQHLRDATDFTTLLRELVVVIELEEMPGRRFRYDDTCHACGHVHQDRECGKDMGGAGVCKCDVEVRA